MIVYTANYGNRDFELPAHARSLYRPGRPALDISDVEFVYFTDMPREIEGWNVVVEKRPEDTPLMQSKWYKIHSHELFPNDVSMYIDANYALNNVPHEEVAITNAERPVTIYKHYRASLNAEFNKCRKWTTYPSRKDYDAQRRAYKEHRTCYDLQIPVYHGSVLLRHPDAAEFNKVWWTHLHTYTPRDQLSLSYLAHVWHQSINVRPQLPASKLVLHAATAYLRIDGSKVFYGDSELSYAFYREQS